MSWAARPDIVDRVGVERDQPLAVQLAERDFQLRLAPLEPRAVVVEWVDITRLELEFVVALTARA